MRFSRTAFVAALALTFGGTAWAEVTRLPFFPSAPIFTDEAEGFSGLDSWGAFDQGLNQDEATENAHGLDIGSCFTFFSCREISFSGLMRERFQFRASPDGEFTFWTRALVTDLRMTLSWKLAPFILSAGYRHDCKHDFGKTGRVVIHDAVFSRILLPGWSLPLTRGPEAADAGMYLEAEKNLPLLFQKGDEEPDRGRLSIGAELYPLGKSLFPVNPFLDAYLSAIWRRSLERVTGIDEWNVDARVSAGAEFKTGHGGLRLFWFTERTTDPWAEFDAKCEHLQAVELQVFSSW